MTTEPAPDASLYPKSIPSAALTSDRFRVVRAIGSGGMATVFEVVDRASGKQLALKRLHPEPDPKRRRRLLGLFEREFYTLSQISHPRVVEVYDYGVDEQGAYYTMELLSGAELQSFVPLPYREVCSIGRDLCSALSLLHSRRLVYRDLNPRNVHCTTEGHAKLLDFGAVTAIGPERQIVGTPGYCAPEALDQQPLDARTDLYSLGATLYFALTGRHAYACKSFEQLRACWGTQPARPCELCPGVPPALDALIMDLLHLEPALRPANAAEVMEQLAAIDGTKIEEQLQVTQAYLVTPTLVGREALLGRTRAKLLRSLRGSGSALVLHGSSGVGRTRLLGACSLEAQLLGVLVLRADASDATSDYGVVRALASELRQAAPELAQRCASQTRALLGLAVPELLAQPEPLESAQFSDPNQERVQLMAALKDWFMAVADTRPLALAIDDLHRIDEPSATLLALCAHAANAHALVILTTRESELSADVPAALQVFESAASSVHVSNLSAPQLADLLGSVFGHVPHVQDLALQLHGIAAGNPRDTLQLAQYLVDRGVARYQAGAWSLPASFDDADLPPDMSQALHAQVAAMSGTAQELGRLISLIRDRSVGLEECAALYPARDKRELHEALEELCTTQAAKRMPEGYSIAHNGFHAALQQGLGAADQQRLHLLAAGLFASRGDDEFRRALHLLEAGEPAQSLDVFVPYAARSQELTNSAPTEYVKLVRAMPGDWLELYTRSLAACEELQRPASDTLILRGRLSGLLNIMRAPGAISRTHLLALQRTLIQASGLEDYAALDPDLPASERLRLALTLADARYAACPEHARTLPPSAAIPRLIRSHVAAGGMVATAQDYELWSGLVSLEPFVPLAAAAEVTELFNAGVGARIIGRYEQSRHLYLALLKRSEAPDGAGLDPTNLHLLVYGVKAALGVIEAAMGLDSCLSWADAIEDDPLFRTSAMVVRMLHEFWQGRVRDADQLKEKTELLRVQTSPRRMSEGIHLVAQVCAHANSDDLTRTKHAIDEIRALASRHSGWLPILNYALGEYQRIRGDQAQATLLLEAALADCSAGTSQIWPHAAAALTRVLLNQGRAEEACEFGLRSLRAAEAAELGYFAHFIRMQLALALAETDRIAEAALLADEVIVGFQALKSSGLLLVLAYETRTRVAIRANNHADYRRFVDACADECRNTSSRVLRAKYERLVRAAASGQVAHGNTDLNLSTFTGTEHTSLLVGCDQPRERAERCLTLLLRRSGTQAGFLFLMGDHGPQLSAQAGTLEASPALATLVGELIDSELHDQELSTGSLEQADAAQAETNFLDEHGEQYRLILLHHQLQEGFAISGAAALLIEQGATFQHPGALAAHLSRLLFDAGDVTPVLGE